MAVVYFVLPVDVSNKRIKHEPKNNTYNRKRVFVVGITADAIRLLSITEIDRMRRVYLGSHIDIQDEPNTDDFVCAGCVVV